MIQIKKKTIGIIGGMGPMATVDLFHKVVALTDANSDRDHIHIVIDCNPGIPDRTAALLNGGENPVPYIREIAQKLQAMGADILILPCNTSHAFYQDIVKDLELPLVNMIEETVRYVAEKGLKRVGLLATDGTVMSKVYENAFHCKGIDVILPNVDEQKTVMDMIYRGVKAGNTQMYIAPFRVVVERMKDNGVQSFVLGCTELPLVVDRIGVECTYIDPTVILAKAAIQMAGYSVRE